MKKDKEKKQIEEKEEDISLLGLLLVLGIPFLILGVVFKYLPDQETFGQMSNVFLIISYVVLGLAALVFIVNSSLKLYNLFKSGVIDKNQLIWIGLGILIVGWIAIDKITTFNPKNMTVDEIYQVVQNMDVYQIRKITSKMSDEQIDKLVERMSEKQFYKLVEGMNSLCGVYIRGSFTQASISIPAYSIITDLCPTGPYWSGKRVSIDVEWGNQIRREENDRYHNSLVRLNGKVILIKDFWAGQEISDKPIIRTPNIDDLW